jgi:hypothetical protein
MEIKGFLEKDGSYFVFEQVGLDDSHCLGDVIWAGYDHNNFCDVLLVAEWISDDDLLGWYREFDIDHKVIAAIDRKVKYTCR